jgi:uncharacterized protein YfeS
VVGVQAVVGDSYYVSEKQRATFWSLAFLVFQCTSHFHVSFYYAAFQEESPFH